MRRVQDFLHLLDEGYALEVCLEEGFTVDTVLVIINKESGIEKHLDVVTPSNEELLAWNITFDDLTINPNRSHHSEPLSSYSLNQYKE